MKLLFLQVNTPDGSPSHPRRRKCFLPCEEDCEEKQCCATTALSPSSSHQETLEISVQNVSSSPAASSLHILSSSSSPDDENLSDETNLEPELRPMMI